MPRYLRGLLVAVAVIGTALGAAACGPGSHPQHKHTQSGPGGY
ncbi:MAG TPA: hypothetical protein VMU94_31295 [Streptosporangiaceae bacterium]|nr:hypothetical protein [Streptosporangiaceae bacterium]